MSTNPLTVRGLTIDELLDFHRATFGDAVMEADGGEGGDGSEGGEGATGDGETQTFTQADVDRLVGKARTEERRKVSEKYADYDDLRQRAEGAKTLEDRVADIERQRVETEARAMRAEIANAKGLTPGQAKRLVGSTREELEADADELLADIGEQRNNNNRSPREGNTPKAKATDERAFVRQLFGGQG